MPLTLDERTGTDRILLHRWVLSPVRTPRLYRRMRLAGVRSYQDMVDRGQALEGYRVWLTQELGGDLSKATDEQLLPMTMVPRGYTVEEALALLAQWKAEADQRAAEAEADGQGRAEAARVRAESRSARRRRRQRSWPPPGPGKRRPTGSWRRRKPARRRLAWRRKRPSRRRSDSLPRPHEPTAVQD
ncbi:hypothetical protein ACF1CG_34695 [Streptomyces sp. NPDC014773]|uniref:hypothetical protein n=1 Tax=Streptomyces sp. NPDC014773 TaxID=3364908 RepID=UPI003701A6E3